MASRKEHYEAAELALNEAEQRLRGPWPPLQVGDFGDPLIHDALITKAAFREITLLIAAAQVHATLATAGGLAGNVNGEQQVRGVMPG